MPTSPAFSYFVVLTGRSCIDRVSLSSHSKGQRESAADGTGTAGGGGERWLTVGNGKTEEVACFLNSSMTPVMIAALLVGSMIDEASTMR